MPQFRRLIEQLAMLTDAAGGLRVGTITTRKDGDYKKVAPGEWERVSDGKKSKVPEPTGKPGKTVAAPPAPKSSSGKSAAAPGKPTAKTAPKAKGSKAASKSSGASEPDEDKPAAPTAAIAACGKGNFGAARHEISSHLRYLGLKKANSKGQFPVDTVEVSDEGLSVLDYNGNPLTAVGLRFWNGKIQLSEQSANAMKELSKLEAYGGYEGAKLKIKALTDDIRDKQLRDEPIRELQDQVGELQDAMESGKQIHTLIHEVLHDYSPGGTTAYSGIGGSIEEITTEVSARRVSRDWIGFDIDAGEDKSYENIIDQARKAIVVAADRTAPEAAEILSKASLRYKQRTEVLENANAVARALAEDIAHVAAESGAHKVSVDDIEKALHEHVVGSKE